MNSGCFASGCTCHNGRYEECHTFLPHACPLGLLQLPYQLVLCASWRLLAAWLIGVKQRSLLRAPQPVGAGTCKPKTEVNVPYCMLPVCSYTEAQSCSPEPGFMGAGPALQQTPALQHTCGLAGDRAHCASRLRLALQAAACKPAVSGRCCMPSCSKHAIFASLRTELSAQQQLSWSDCASKGAPCAIKICSLVRSRAKICRLCNQDAQPLCTALSQHTWCATST